MLDIASFYDVVGLKELLAAVQAVPFKAIDSLIDSGGLIGMVKSIFGSLRQNCGDDPANFDQMLIELVDECEKEIAAGKGREAASKEATPSGELSRVDDKKDNSAQAPAAALIDKTKE